MFVIFLTYVTIEPISTSKLHVVSLTLAVKYEPQSVTVVLCPQGDGIIVASTTHYLLHPRTETNHLLIAQIYNSIFHLM